MSIDPSIIHKLLSSSSRINNSDLILLQCINIYDIYKIYIRYIYIYQWAFCQRQRTTSSPFWSCRPGGGGTVINRIHLSFVYQRYLGRLPQLPHWLAFIMFGLQLPRSYWAAVVWLYRAPTPHISTFSLHFAIHLLISNISFVEGGMEGGLLLFCLPLGIGSMHVYFSLITPFLPFLQIRSL